MADDAPRYFGLYTNKELVALFVRSQDADLANMRLYGGRAEVRLV